MTTEELANFAKMQLVFDGTAYLTVEDACKRRNVSPIIERFGAWAVTSYGVECLIYSYFFEANRAFENNWDHHLQSKYWPVPDTYQEQFKADALSALDCCRELVQKVKIGYGARYRILRKNNFRCKACGRSALDGTVLEVDHILPRSKGGDNDDSNLQALCADCNRGKSDKYL